MIKSLFGMLLACATGAQAADESLIRLKDGPGRELVQSNCVMCHSLDYIQMNSPFLDRKGWEAEVGKMVNAYHASIDKNNIQPIVDYLTLHYGASNPSAADGSAPKLP